MRLVVHVRVVVAFRLLICTDEPRHDAPQDVTPLRVSRWAKSLEWPAPADVAELVDARRSGRRELCARGGSSPLIRMLISGAMRDALAPDRRDTPDAPPRRAPPTTRRDQRRRSRAEPQSWCGRTRTGRAPGGAARPATPPSPQLRPARRRFRGSRR